MKAFTLLAFILISSRLLAWGDLGHQAVAEVAERNLTPKARAMIFKILGGEPLAVSAVFPDQVRSDKRYNDFANYHFIEILDGKTAAESVAALAKDKSADIFISKGPLMLFKKSTPNEQKILILRYLIHILGDIHQPLHVGNGSDMGANLCDVKWVNPSNGKSEELNLHSVWDDHLFDYTREDLKKKPGPKQYFTYNHLIDFAMDAAKDIDKNTPINTIEWYDESRKLHESVYPEPYSKMKADERPFCKKKDPVTNKVVNGAFDKAKIPTLDEAYARKSLQVAYRQVIKGGYRLAAVLNNIAKDDAEPATSPSEDFDALLKAIHLESVDIRTLESAIKKKPRNVSNEGK